MVKKQRRARIIAIGLRATHLMRLGGRVRANAPSFRLGRSYLSVIGVNESGHSPALSTHGVDERADTLNMNGHFVT